MCHKIMKYYCELAPKISSIISKQLGFMVIANKRLSFSSLTLLLVCEETTGLFSWAEPNGLEAPLDGDEFTLLKSITFIRVTAV